MEQVNLYSSVPSLGENIPLTVTPAEVDESVPMEDEIEEVKVVRSRTDYLLGTDRSLFRNVSEKDPRKKHRPIYGVGLLTQRPKMGTHPLHHGKAENSAPTTYGAYEGGQDI